jgi:transcriptional antiterminator NusG
MAEKSWFVLHTYAGFENKVKSALEGLRERDGIADGIGVVLVPTQNVTEFKEGKKKVSTRKVFPGYVLIELDPTDEMFHFVKAVPKVTGFLGNQGKPQPMTATEVNELFHRIEEGTAMPAASEQFFEGDSIRITDGPFQGFTGAISGVDSEHGKVRVLVSIFGRQTPVELDFLQIERA